MRLIRAGEMMIGAGIDVGNDRGWNDESKDRGWNDEIKDRGWNDEAPAKPNRTNSRRSGDYSAYVICDMRHAMCCMRHATCHVPRATCHVPR